MKQLWHMIERYYPWLLLLLGVDCFCAVILWISDIQVFQTLIGLVVLTSILFPIMRMCGGFSNRTSSMRRLQISDTRAAVSYNTHNP